MPGTAGTTRGVALSEEDGLRSAKKLYMAALVASRHHPRLKGIYEHLITRGKPAKVALTALMRHLIIQLNHNLKPKPQKTANNT